MNTHVHDPLRVADLCIGASVRYADQQQHLTGWPRFVIPALLPLAGTLAARHRLLQRPSWQ